MQLRILVFLVSLLAPPQVFAVDHNNLDEGRPTRLEDAYPIAYGELSTESGVGAEFTGPTERTPFFATLGLSAGF
jgi:hypothetical protein